MPQDHETEVAIRRTLEAARTVNTLKDWNPEYGVRPLAPAEVEDLYARAGVAPPIAFDGGSAETAGFVTPAGPERTIRGVLVPACEGPQVMIDGALEGRDRSFVLLHELAHVLLGDLDGRQEPTAAIGGGELLNEMMCDSIAALGALGKAAISEPAPDTLANPIEDAFLPIFRGHGDARFRLIMSAGFVPVLVSIAADEAGEVAHAA